MPADYLRSQHHKYPRLTSVYSLSDRTEPILGKSKSPVTLLDIFSSIVSAASNYYALLMLTAHALYSGIFARGSLAGLVSLFAGASA